MSHDDIETRAVDESTTPTYTAQFVDVEDQPVSGSALDSLTVTFYQEYTRVIVNGRDKQHVLQANGITVDDAGLLTWPLEVGDTEILDDALEHEPHRALFEFSYAGANGPKYGKHEVRFLVKNLEKVS